jgi:hypothetical protein
MPYAETRLQLIGERKKIKNDLIYFSKLGAFVFERWMAEEEERGDNQFNEAETSHLWDECNQNYLEVIEAKMREVYHSDIRSGRIGEMLKLMKPWSSWGSIIGWITLEMTAGVLGLFGLMFAVFLMNAMIPDFKDHVRSVISVILPSREEGRAHDNAGSPDNNHFSSPDRDKAFSVTPERVPATNSASGRKHDVE